MKTFCSIIIPWQRSGGDWRLEIGRRPPFQTVDPAAERVRRSWGGEVKFVAHWARRGLAGRGAARERSLRSCGQSEVSSMTLFAVGSWDLAWI
jgi:hypothetical protein